MYGFGGRFYRLFQVLGGPGPGGGVPTLDETHQPPSWGVLGGPGKNPTLSIFSGPGFGTGGPRGTPRIDKKLTFFEIIVPKPVFSGFGRPFRGFRRPFPGFLEVSEGLGVISRVWEVISVVWEGF